MKKNPKNNKKNSPGNIKKSLRLLKEERGLLKKALVRCRTEIKNTKIAIELEVARRTEALKATAEHYKEFSESKDEFIRITNHELRTPLDVIRGNIDMVLKGETGEIAKKTQEYLGDALLGADRLTKLVSDTLDVSRIETGRMKFTLENVDLSSILGTIRDDFTQIAKEKQISVYLKLAENLPKVFSDSSKIFQILNDFLGNALKFVPPGGSITIHAYQEDETVVIATEDTGIGIKPEDQEKLFKRFPQIDTGMVQAPKGTGLGLYLVKQLSDKLGGEVWAESEGLGKGSKFFIRLPQAGTERAKSLERYHANLLKSKE